MNAEIDSIIEKALSSMGRDFIDGDIVETRESFSDFIVILMKTAFPDHEVSLKGDRLSIEKAKWCFSPQYATIFEKLEPFSPGHNRDLVVRFLRGCLHSMDAMKMGQEEGAKPSIQLDKLVMVPRLGSFMRETTKRITGQDDVEVQDVFLSRPVYDYVHSVIALDSPTHIAFISKGGLKDMGLTEDQVFDVAMTNIKKRAQNLKLDFSDGYAIVDSHDMGGLASQLIFHTDFWKSVSEEVKDDLFIHVLDQSALMVCKASDRVTIMNIFMSAATGKLESLLPATFFTYDQKGFRIFAKLLPDDA